MTEQALDPLARRVILDTARLEYGALLKEAPEHSFSPSFERKMKRLLRRGRHPIWYKALHAAACLLLALLLSGCAVLAVSPAAREAFAGWVREVHDTYFSYQYVGPDQDVQEDLTKIAFLPTWLPEGYQEAERPQLYGMVNISYEADGKETAVFGYAPELSMTVYTENAEAHEAQVHGRRADLYLDGQEGNRNVLVWTDEDTGFFLWISAPFSGEELVKMAESVETLPLAYCPAWVPEGYTLLSGGAKLPVILNYQGQDGNYFTLLVMENAKSTEMEIELEKGDSYQTASVLGKPADMYLGAEGHISVLIWMDNKEQLTFNLCGTLTEQELMKVAESIGKAQ